jgi:glycosyltransferase involved in cell wall biosynthesis
MKFSVLLPTRNRVELLQYAVQSVIDQDHEDWEVIISDNDSEQDVRGFVESLREPRIIYRRTEAFLPVTDNWNRALESSSGDYLIMLGDDDCLLRGCLSTAKRLLESHGQPQMMYTEAVQYQYPRVQPGQEVAFTQFGYCDFLQSRDAPFFLEHRQALDLVRKSMGFRITFSYNMQHTFVSRELIGRLKSKGPFFQSPYPDYYATNALLLTAERVLVCPWPLVAIGISPKSFGFYYLNQRETDGTEFLRNVAEKSLAKRVKHIVLPGTDMNTSWLLAMEALQQNLGAELGLRVHYWRYRFLQLRHLYRTRRSRRQFLRTVWQLGTVGERLLWLLLVGSLPLLARFVPRRKRAALEEKLLNLIHQSHPYFDPRRRDVPYQNILELCRNMDPAVPPTMIAGQG